MSIVAMKRKSRKFNKPISSGPNGFSISGVEWAPSTMTTSGYISKITRASPIVHNPTNDATRKNILKYDSHEMRIFDIAREVEQCLDNRSGMTNSGTPSCTKDTYYRGMIHTLTKSDHAYGAIPSSQHIRTICRTDQ